MYFQYIFLLYLPLHGYAQNNLQPLVKLMGGTLCRFLVEKSQLPRQYLRLCGEPNCHWDEWIHLKPINESSSKMIVLSYAHNGFGNQLWEHSVAFMVAESMNAQFFISSIPSTLSPNGVIPPNTFVGMDAMERLLPWEFHYDKLDSNSEQKKVCEEENFFISDRPKDWRDKNYTNSFKSSIYDLLTDKKPRCLKLLGYFQNLPLCASDTKRLWTDRLFANFSDKPGPQDVSIYLRCLPRHYHFNDKVFYQTILNNTKYDKVWLFQAPECPTRLNPNPAKDGLVSGVLRLLLVQYNATRWKRYPGDENDETAALLFDLAGLALSKKLILPVSSWAFWAGFLSNAMEIHVNAPPLHSLMHDRVDQYVYHNEKTKEYFGKYNNRSNDIEYNITLVDPVLAKVADNLSILAKQVVIHSGIESSERNSSFVMLPTADSKNQSKKMNHDLNVPIGNANAIASRQDRMANKKIHHHSSSFVQKQSALSLHSNTSNSPLLLLDEQDGPETVDGNKTAAASDRLPIVFVYTVVPAVCQYGLPIYIRDSLEQAILSQPDCDVILASNFKDCDRIRTTLHDMEQLILFDTTRFTSNRTLLFRNASSLIFQKDNHGELWMTSALRFFLMEDLMKKMKYSEIFHVEADNLLYSPIRSILSTLRTRYGGLAATPLTANKAFITASVFWVAKLSSLIQFNQYLLDIATNDNNRWKSYLTWIRPFACCKAGGVDPDESGNGIRPFAINEMSMLGYYHFLHPMEFRLLPVVPSHNYVLNRYVCNMSHFGPNGSETGGPTGKGVWDPNSWGQYLGGTSSKHGKDKGFTDPTHIAGQAIRTSGCFVEMLCSNVSIPHAEVVMKPSNVSVLFSNASNDSASSENRSSPSTLQTMHQASGTTPYNMSSSNGSDRCYTAPFVKCKTSLDNAKSIQFAWTPLWNLHVHSKHTTGFKSQSCSC